MPHPCAFIDGLGGPELMVILFIVLLLFGADKMPELAKGLGKSLREFKKAANSVETEIRRAMEEHEDAPKKSPATLPATTPPVPLPAVAPAMPPPSDHHPETPPPNA